MRPTRSSTRTKKKPNRFEDEHDEPAAVAAAAAAVRTEADVGKRKRGGDDDDDNSEDDTVKRVKSDASVGSNTKVDATETDITAVEDDAAEVDITEQSKTEDSVEDVIVEKDADATDDKLDVAVEEENTVGSDKPDVADVDTTIAETAITTQQPTPKPSPKRSHRRQDSSSDSDSNWLGASDNEKDEKIAIGKESDESDDDATEDESETESKTSADPDGLSKVKRQQSISEGDEVKSTSSKLAEKTRNASRGSTDGSASHRKLSGSTTNRKHKSIGGVTLGDDSADFEVPMSRARRDHAVSDGDAVKSETMLTLDTSVTHDKSATLSGTALPQDVTIDNAVGVVNMDSDRASSRSEERTTATQSEDVRSRSESAMDPSSEQLLSKKNMQGSLEESADANMADYADSDDNAAEAVSIPTAEIVAGTVLIDESPEAQAKRAAEREYRDRIMHHPVPANLHTDYGNSVTSLDERISKILNLNSDDSDAYGAAVTKAKDTSENNGGQSRAKPIVTISLSEPSDKYATTTSEKIVVYRRRLQRLKMMIYSYGRSVHTDTGYDKFFMKYWNALSHSLLHDKQSHMLPEWIEVIRVFLRTKNQRKLHNKLIKELLSQSYELAAMYAKPVAEESGNDNEKNTNVDNDITSIDLFFSDKPYPSVFSYAKETLSNETPASKAAMSETRLPGLLSVESVVEDAVAKAGIEAAEQVSLLFTIAIKEYLVKVLRECVLTKRISQSNNSRLSLNSNIATTTKNDHCLSVEDLFIMTAGNTRDPSGVKNRVPNRMFFESVSMACSVSSIVSGTMKQVGDTLKSDILAKAKIVEREAIAKAKEQEMEANRRLKQTQPVESVNAVPVNLSPKSSGVSPLSQNSQMAMMMGPQKQHQQLQSQQQQQQHKQLSPINNPTQHHQQQQHQQQQHKQLSPVNNPVHQQQTQQQQHQQIQQHKQLSPVNNLVQQYQQSSQSMQQQQPQSHPQSQSAQHPAQQTSQPQQLSQLQPIQQPMQRTQPQPMRQQQQQVQAGQVSYQPMQQFQMMQPQQSQQAGPSYPQQMQQQQQQTPNQLHQQQVPQRSQPVQQPLSQPQPLQQAQQQVQQPRLNPIQQQPQMQVFQQPQQLLQQQQQVNSQQQQQQQMNPQQMLYSQQQHQGQPQQPMRPQQQSLQQAPQQQQPQQQPSPQQHVQQPQIQQQKQQYPQTQAQHRQQQQQQYLHTPPQQQQYTQPQQQQPQQPQQYQPQQGGSSSVNTATSNSEPANTRPTMSRSASGLSNRGLGRGAKDLAALKMRSSTASVSSSQAAVEDTTGATMTSSSVPTMIDTSDKTETAEERRGRGSGKKSLAAMMRRSSQSEGTPTDNDKSVASNNDGKSDVNR